MRPVDADPRETVHRRKAHIHTYASTTGGVDTFSGLLDGARARGAFALRMIMDPPWSVRIQDRAPLSLVAVVRGDAWFVPDVGEPTRLGPGDVAIMRGPDAVRVRRRPGDAAPSGDPPRPALHDARRRGPPSGDAPRRAVVGQRSPRIVGDAGRHLRDRDRGEPTAAGRVAVGGRPPRRHVGLAPHPGARRGGRARRRGPERRARPAARPVARRGAACMVRATRGRTSLLVPRPERPGGRQGDGDAPPQPGRAVDRRRRSPPRSVSRGPRSLGGSPSSSANRP